MPRTAAKNNQGRKSDPNRDHLARWEKLPPHDKVICWNYFQYTATQGEEGWNPAEAGSLFHQRSSSYLLSLGSGSWFRHRAKLMVTLANKFAELNQTPPRPPNLQPQPTAAGTTPSTPKAKPAPAAEPMQAPSPKGKKAPSAPRVAKMPAPASMSNDDYAGLAAPTSFGMYKQFNYTTRKTSINMLVRTILHNGVSDKDIEFQWITPRVLKLRVAWPDWFQMAEQMAQFTVDDDGIMIFPPEHPLTMDTSERNQALVQEDGRIWDEGFLSFEQDMEEDIPVFELLKVEIPSKATVVTVLQIFVT